MNSIAVCCLLLLACLGRCAHARTARAARAPGIYYGEPVNITDVPFMARLRPSQASLSCGAVIVHEHFLISAAHCYNPESIVTVSTDNLKNGTGQDYEIEKLFVHPKNNRSTGEYDLMVVKLKKKLTFSDRVRPIKMADPDLVIKDDEMMDTMGFGFTEHETISEQLLKVDVPLYNQEKCRDYIKRTIDMDVTESMICAGGVGKKAVCNGDSGGPLRYKDMVVGLTSFSRHPCSLLDNPDVFARVSIMRPFIDDIIKNNS